MTNSFSAESCSDDDDFEPTPPKIIRYKSSSGSKTRSKPCSSMVENVAGPSTFKRDLFPLADIETRLKKVEDVLQKEKKMEEKDMKWKDKSKSFSQQLTISTSKLEEYERCIKTVNDNLQCLICKCILCDEFTVMSCCQVLTCTSCLTEWKAQSPTCPHCRAQIEDAYCRGIPQNRHLSSVLEAVRNVEIRNVNIPDSESETVIEL